MKILFAVLCCLAQDFPEPDGYINDHVGVMESSDVVMLNRVITELKQKTGAELAFLIIPTVKPLSKESYANQLMEKWKVGDAKKSNGVIVVIAIQDKVWAVRTGYGVEGALPDSKVGEMARNYFTPLFRKGKYSEGVVNFCAAILAVLADEYDVTLTGAPKATKGGSSWLSIIGLIMFVVIIGSVFSRRGSRGSWPLLLFFGMSGGGWGGGGGGSSFGGGGGGGFGGFGGGSFGGGGASGSW